MCAGPVSPMRNASCRVLATKGQSATPDSQWASRIPRRKTAASLMAGGRGAMVLQSGVVSVPMTDEMRAAKGRECGRQTE